MTVIYPAVFTYEDGSYNVDFPDLEGCHTYGESIEEAINNARDALAGWTAVALENGIALPKASDIKSVSDCGGFVTLIDAKPVDSRVAVKKTLTIPAWLNDLSEKAHAPYSKILQEGLERYLDLA